MSKIFIVTSGKGGTGKSVIAANIARGLALQKKKTVILDLCFGLRNLDLYLGLENQIVYHMMDVIQGKTNLRGAAVKDTFCSDLYLMPAPASGDLSQMSDTQFHELIDLLKEKFEYIIVDLPSGVNEQTLAICQGADKILMVTTAEAASLRNCDRMISMLERGGLKDHVYLILNHIRTDLLERGDMMSKEEISDLLPNTVIGMIPEDNKLISTSGHGKSIIGTYTPADTALKDICRRLEGEEVPFRDPDHSGQSKDLIRRIADFFRKNRD